MASAKRKITLSPSRDIPFDRLVLSQANVRRVKAGVSIGELADDIARRTLLQSLNVRPQRTDEGAETGFFEIPAGGRRYRALELLVKQKRLAKDAPVPCIVQQTAGILAEEDIAERIGGEGWKWVEALVDFPYGATRRLRALGSSEVPMTEEEAAQVVALEAEADALSHKWADEPDVPEEVHARLEAIECEIGALADRPQIFDDAEVALAGAFVSIDYDGTIRVDRGFVRAEDEPAAEEEEVADAAEPSNDNEPDREAGADAGGEECDGSGADAEEDTLKPLPERIVSDLTAWRTLALQDAFAASPQAAFAAVLHALVLSIFYRTSHETCLKLSVSTVYFTNEPAGLRNCAPARSIEARHAAWREKLPTGDADLWDALLALDANEQAMLFAHCASLGVNAQAEILPKYPNGRISAHGVERRIVHSHVLARVVNLDVVAAGWRPTADGYFRGVTKARLLADVAEARGPEFAGMIDHLKKPDMAREAEKLLEDSGWVPEPMRTPALEAVGGDADAGHADAVPGTDEAVTGTEALGGEGDGDGDWDEMPVAAE